MSTKVRYASMLAVAVTCVTTLVGADRAGAAAQAYEAAVDQPTASAPAAVEPADSPVPVQPAAEPAPVQAAPPVAPAAPAPATQTLSPELNCLAGAIYFEAKGESLAGQLAVGRVVVARAKSGRFPSSYCGVVYQRSQFSFVRGRSMPRIDKAGASWATAVRMARIADAGSQRSPAEGALFFHASHVSPKWRLTRVARIDNHIFYR